MNRLQLNFALSTKQERVNFTRDYLATIRFQPTEDELDTIAKYILWGKDPETGLNGRQEGLELETRHKTWDGQRTESLDALIESPNFSEAMLRGPSNPPTKIPREVFSRSDARKNAPPHILAALEALWTEIDETELTINFYDLAHGKRKTPPRDSLLKRLPQANIEAARDAASTLQPYAYLKLKHKLVELRREQYGYKDSYKELKLSQPTFSYKEEIAPTFETDITVLPIGIYCADNLARKIFNPDRFPEPDDFTEADLNALSKLLWAPVPSNPHYFDFSNPDHLYQLFGMWEDFNAPDASIYSNISPFMRTAQMYRNLAQLDPILDEILEMKIQKVQNQDIADYINKKYGKKHRANYISTLYCKKCLGEIATAATKHREVLENIFFPENFKKCKDCGRVLLMNEENFVRRARSNDGFSPRCKRCEKAKRAKR